MPDYGSDLSCEMDLNPLLLLVSGETLMGQVCIHRLGTRQGRLLSNPVDNTIDVRDFIGQGIQARDLPIIQGKCMSALLGDERVSQAVVKATFTTLTNTLDLAIQGDGALGPFNLTLRVSAVTIEILRP